jgi:UDP-glucose:(heptosyl)LPS alpha-1,3-glucosyltransferase
VFDPFYIGALWRDWSFARAACRDVRRSQPSLVEAHDRLLCCDVYRASDGVHAAWIAEKIKDSSAVARVALDISPHSRYLLAMEKRLYASTWLRAVICNSRMVKEEIRRHYGVAESKLHVIYNPVDGELFHPGVRDDRGAILARHGIPADAPVFLVVARNPSRVDVDSAIDAFAGQNAAARMIVLLGTERGTRTSRVRGRRARAVA